MENFGQKFVFWILKQSLLAYFCSPNKEFAFDIFQNFDSRDSNHGIIYV